MQWLGDTLDEELFTITSYKLHFGGVIEEKKERGCHHAYLD
jgi:hypothetical protein